MEPGNSIDGHKLLQKLGEGSMGEVWLCQYLGTRFAVKFLKDQQKVHELQLEAVAQARLAWMDSPEAAYFVKILHFNPSGERPYLRMEYIEGQSLAKVIESKPLPVDQALPIFEHLLRAMAFAHRHECVHADLKPQNLIVPASGQPRIKIIDMGFGMALEALMSEDELRHSMQASVSERMGYGTLLYAPPERFTPEFLHDKGLAKACDMFSVGKIIYQTLTAKRPTNVTPLEKKIQGLPAGFDDFMLKCVENDSKDRYTSAEEGLRDWLAMIERGKPKETKPAKVEPDIVIGSDSDDGGDDIEYIDDQPATAKVATPEIEIVSSVEVVQLRTLRGHKDAVTGTCFLPDGLIIASCGDDRSIKLWDVQSGRKTRSIVAHDDSVNAIASHAQLIATGSDDRTVKLWKSNGDGELTSETLQGHSGGVTSVAFSQDGKMLASGSYDRSVKVWNVESLEEAATLKGHSDSVRCVAFSPDGLWLASASRDRTIKVWQTRSFKEAFTLLGHEGAVSAVAFSPFGKILASGSYDGTVRLWNISSGNEIACLRGHTDYVRTVAFAPGGKILASAGSDKTIKLWDVATCEELTSMDGHTSSVYWIAFSPQGTLVASAGLDRTIRIWELKNQAG